MRRASDVVTWGAIGLSALGSLVMPGCGREEVPMAEQASRAKTIQVDPYVLSDSARIETKESRLAAIRDVGNGVYVFPAHYFPETLADFREKNPAIEVVSISHGDALYGGGHGYQSGCPANFFVITARR